MCALDGREGKLSACACYRGTTYVSAHADCVNVDNVPALVNPRHCPTPSVSHTRFGGIDINDARRVPGRFERHLITRAFRQELALSIAARQFKHISAPKLPASGHSLSKYCRHIPTRKIRFSCQHSYK